MLHALSRQKNHMKNGSYATDNICEEYESDWTCLWRSSVTQIFYVISHALLCNIISEYIAPCVYCLGSGSRLTCPAVDPWSPVAPPRSRRNSTMIISTTFELNSVRSLCVHPLLLLLVLPPPSSSDSSPLSSPCFFLPFCFFLFLLFPRRFLPRFSENGILRYKKIKFYRKVRGLFDKTGLHLRPKN